MLVGVITFNCRRGNSSKPEASVPRHTCWSSLQTAFGAVAYAILVGLLPQQLFAVAPVFTCTFLLILLSLSFSWKKESNQRKFKKGTKQPVPFIVPWLSCSATVASAFVVYACSVRLRDSNFWGIRGSAVLHHSSTKAKLKNQSENGLLSFSEVFFCFFFGQAKKKIF